MKISACGVCASDLHVVDGELPEPMPLVLGHEAAGVVAEAGPGVEGLEEGDHVVLALVPCCGECDACRKGRRNFCELAGRMAATGTLADGTSRLSLNGTELRRFNAISSFAEYAVVPRVDCRPDPPRRAARGRGSLWLRRRHGLRRGRSPRVEPGARVAVWGCGGVGLNSSRELASPAPRRSSRSTRAREARLARARRDRDRRGR